MCAGKVAAIATCCPVEILRERGRKQNRGAGHPDGVSEKYMLADAELQKRGSGLQNRFKSLCAHNLSCTRSKWNVGSLSRGMSDPFSRPTRAIVLLICWPRGPQTLTATDFAVPYRCQLQATSRRHCFTFLALCVNLLRSDEVRSSCSSSRSNFLARVVPGTATLFN